MPRCSKESRVLGLCVNARAAILERIGVWSGNKSREETLVEHIRIGEAYEQ
jgi:hypothetical protein